MNSVDEAKLIEDVKRYKSLFEQEVQDVKGHLRGKLTSTSVSEDFLEEFCDLYADLSIRVKVLEAAVRSELFVNQEIVDLLKQNKSFPVKSQYFQETISLNAADLESLDGFAPAETNEEGVSYCWTIDKTEIPIPLLVSRKEDKVLKVRFVGEVKPELISTLQLWVDGNSIPFDLGFDGEFNCLTALLPNMTVSQLTQVLIKLQGVFSPEELSNGSDKRKLGIAIESISTMAWKAPKVGLLRRVARRVKRAFV